MNQLIEKMTDDMQLRGFSPKTIYAYTSHVKRFEEHFEKHPARMGEKQVRQYLLHVISQGISSSYANGCYSALRFLYETTMSKDWNMKNIPRSKKQSKLPIVLSLQEVLSLFNAVSNLERDFIQREIQPPLNVSRVHTGLSRPLAPAAYRDGGA